MISAVWNGKPSSMRSPNPVVTKGSPPWSWAFPAAPLSRKLKLYSIDPVRSHGKLQSDVAELGDEQQLRFRYSIELPMAIVASGERFLVRSRNVSCGGVCLQGAHQLPKISGNLSITFRLPGSNTPIEATGRIVWTDREGTVGIRFVNASQHSQIALNQWLKEKQEAEGWL
jgi:hypothetical protein